MKNTVPRRFLYRVLIVPASIILCYLSGCADGYNSRVNIQGMRILGDRDDKETSPEVDWDSILKNGNDIDELAP